MEQWNDLYSILQIAHDAEQAVIDGAYKHLCKKYHPDINPSSAAVMRMQKINNAYSVLRDPETRRKYHDEWMRRSKNRFSQDSSHTTFTKEKPKWVHRQAYEAIDNYFINISHNNLQEAYALISDIDKQRISLKEFVEWQESVSSSYTLGNHSVNVFKYYDHYVIDGSGRYRAEEYTVTVTEKNNITSSISEYNFSKLAIFENTDWRVYLGYMDLTPIINKFQFTANAKNEAAMIAHWEEHLTVTDITTGLPNLNGLNKLLEVECYRAKRYRRELVIAKIAYELPRKLNGTVTYEHIVKHMAENYKKCFRITDSVTCPEKDTIVLVLPETSLTVAAEVIERAINSTCAEIGKCYDLKLKQSCGLIEYRGEDYKKCYKNVSEVCEQAENMAIRFGEMVIEIS